MSNPNPRPLSLRTAKRRLYAAAHTWLSSMVALIPAAQEDVRVDLGMSAVGLTITLGAPSEGKSLSIIGALHGFSSEEMQFIVKELSSPHGLEMVKEAAKVINQSFAFAEELGHEADRKLAAATEQQLPDADDPTFEAVVLKALAENRGLLIG